MFGKCLFEGIVVRGSQENGLLRLCIKFVFAPGMSCKLCSYFAVIARVKVGLRVICVSGGKNTVINRQFKHWIAIETDELRA